MIQLQELILRARFLFSKAQRRLEVFTLINGNRSAKDIAIKTGRSIFSVSNDLKKLKDNELIIYKKNKEGNTIKKQGSIIYEKMPLIKHVPLSYFKEVSKTNKYIKKKIKKQGVTKKISKIHIPSEKEILDICKNGEDQLYEFKESGTDITKISKEIAAFLHTKKGGIIFYGLDDNGGIKGSDLTRQDFDQRLQNSIRNTILPPPNIDIKDKNVIGIKVIMVIIPPWDRKTIYQYSKSEKFYIRKGTSIFPLKPEEIKKLSKGEYVA